MAAAVRADFYSADLTTYLVPNPRICGRKQLTPPFQCRLIWDVIRPMLADAQPIAAGATLISTRNNALTAANAATFVTAMLHYFIEASSSELVEYNAGDLIVFQADHAGQVAAVAAPPVPATPLVAPGTHEVAIEVELVVNAIVNTTSNRYPVPTTLRQFLRWYTKEAKTIAGMTGVRPSGLDNGMPPRYKTIAFDFCYGPLANLSTQQSLALSAVQFVAIDPVDNVVNTDARFHGGLVPRTSRRLMN